MEGEKFRTQKFGKIFYPQSFTKPSHEIRFLKSFQKSKFRLRISVQSFPCSPIPLQKSLSKERVPSCRPSANNCKQSQTTANNRQLYLAPITALG
jgi:hypothetical protein